MQLGVPRPVADGDAMAAVPLRRYVLCYLFLAKFFCNVCLSMVNRAGTVQDAAGAMLLLASPYSSYITGHCLEVTGGFGI